MIVGTESASEGGSVRDKIAKFGHTSSSYRPTSASKTTVGVNRMGGHAGGGGGGSVRDKIAQFGDKNAGVASNVVISSAPSNRFQPAKTSSYASRPAVGRNSAPLSVAASTGANIGLEPSAAPVRKLKVPDVFQNATKPPDVPAPVRAPSAPTKKWGTVGGTAASGIKGSKPSVGARGGGPNSYSANARGSTSSASSASSSSGSSIKRQPKRDRSVKTDPPKRDLLGLASLPKAGSARTLGTKPAVSNPVPCITLPSAATRSKSSPQPKAGPRRLQLKTISAEKQRAALGLDKDNEDDL